MVRPLILAFPSSSSVATVPRMKVVSNSIIHLDTFPFTGVARCLCIELIYQRAVDTISKTFESACEGYSRS